MIWLSALKTPWLGLGKDGTNREALWFDWRTYNKSCCSHLFPFFPQWPLVVL